MMPSIIGTSSFSGELVLMMVVKVMRAQTSDACRCQCESRREWQLNFREVAQQSSDICPTARIGGCEISKNSTETRRSSSSSSSSTTGRMFRWDSRLAENFERAFATFLGHAHGHAQVPD